MRLLANFFSFIFHPLLLMTYALLLFMLLMPFAFGSYEIDRNLLPLVITVFALTFVIPIAGILVMKPLDFIKSYHMETRNERIAPYIVVMLMYFWGIYQFIASPSRSSIPDEYLSVFLGAAIALCIGFIVNLFDKISLHTIGMGGMIGMFLCLYFFWDFYPFKVIGDTGLNSVHVFLLTLIMAGMVGTARLYLNAHSLKQILQGYFVGIVAQFIACYITFSFL